MIIEKANLEDVEEILRVQKLAYMSEAKFYNDYRIDPMVETIEELKRNEQNKVILKAVEDGKIAGSVRGYENNGTCYIGRLFVHPDFQKRGIGKKLMAEIESYFPDCRYELFTGHKSKRNIAIYESLGYRMFEKDQQNDSVHLVYMEK